MPLSSGAAIKSLFINVFSYLTKWITARAGAERGVLAPLGFNRHRGIFYMGDSL